MTGTSARPSGRLRTRGRPLATDAKASVAGPEPENDRRGPSSAAPTRNWWRRRHELEALENDLSRAMAGEFRLFLRRQLAMRASAARRSRASRLTSMDSHRPGVINFVHVGLVVEDLDETVRFLALLGFDCGEAGMFSGEWIDRIIGLENVAVEVVMVRAPDGREMFEVVRFHSPSAGAQEPAPAANRPGLRHVV